MRWSAILLRVWLLADLSMQRWCEKEYLAYAATHEFTDAVAFTYYNKLARECRERADSLLKVLEALNGEVA